MITTSHATSCDHCGDDGCGDGIWTVRNHPGIADSDALHLCGQCLAILDNGAHRDADDASCEYGCEAFADADSKCTPCQAPSADDIVAAIAETMRQQLDTTPYGKRIRQVAAVSGEMGARLESDLQALINCSARNVAQFVLSLLPEVE